jgi:hypothetical protein
MKYVYINLSAIYLHLMPRQNLLKQWHHNVSHLSSFGFATRQSNTPNSHRLRSALPLTTWHAKMYESNDALTSLVTFLCFRHTTTKQPQITLSGAPEPQPSASTPDTQLTANRNKTECLLRREGRQAAVLPIRMWSHGSFKQARPQAAIYKRITDFASQIRHECGVQLHFFRGADVQRPPSSPFCGALYYSVTAFPSKQSNAYWIKYADFLNEFRTEQ